LLVLFDSAIARHQPNDSHWRVNQPLGVENLNAFLSVLASMPSVGAEIILWMATGLALVGFHSVLNAALAPKPVTVAAPRHRAA